MKKQKGFIAITAILVLSALFLSLVISSTTKSVGTTRDVLTVSRGTMAASLSQACVEYAMLNITNKLHYVGDETLSFDTGECEILEINEAPDGTRVIQVLATSGKYVHRVVAELSEISPEPVMSSYKSVIIF